MYGFEGASSTRQRPGVNDNEGQKPHRNPHQHCDCGTATGPQTQPPRQYQCGKQHGLQNVAGHGHAAQRNQHAHRQYVLLMVLL